MSANFASQVESEFILESERESFIEQVREVIETADERGLEREGSQVRLWSLYETSCSVLRFFYGTPFSASYFIPTS